MRSMHSSPTSLLIAQLDELIRRDPAQRGLIGTEREFGPLCPGHLAAAAAELAVNARSVGIVTGFFIPRGQPPAAETDGPLGALFLAAILERLGVEVHVITDDRCHTALLAAARAMDFPDDRVLQTVIDDNETGEAFFQSASGQQLTHLIAIERVGPCHTTASLAGQLRSGVAPLEEFQQHVPLASRDRCHNMRGEAIDAYSGNLHRLFEFAAKSRRDIKTIGIGDGANEIGMGSIPWENLRVRLEGDHAGRIPCRVATDWTIVAGTSNWGGYALAAAIAHMKDAPQALAPYDAAQQLDVLKQMVKHGPAVDGVTRRQEPTVDGLPFLTYIQPLEGIRRVLRID
jgi:hypothetical protein